MRSPCTPRQLRRCPGWQVASLQAEVVRLGELAKSTEAAREEAARRSAKLEAELLERDAKLAAVERLALAKSGEAGRARGEAEAAQQDAAAAAAEAAALRGKLEAAEAAAEQLRAAQREAAKLVLPPASPPPPPSAWAWEGRSDMFNVWVYAVRP